MATLSKAQMAARILENIGVKPAGQVASSEDTNLVTEVIDSAHARLRRMSPNLAPFALATIPEWAQIPFRDYVSADVANVFGVSGERLQAVILARGESLKELRRQVESQDTHVPTRAYYF